MTESIIHDLSEQMYAFATGTQKSFGVRFQTIIETNVLDQGDDIVFSLQQD